MRKKNPIRPGLLVAIAFIVCPCYIQAQFALGGQYISINDGYWNDVFSGAYTEHLANARAMYWFRLKKKRVEFLPEVGYSHNFSTVSVQSALTPDLQAFYLQFNTDVYFLDFGGDCNCPTFSKDGNLVKRGLFAEVSPGIEFRRLGIDYLEQNELSTRYFKKTVPKVYGGLGLDIGLSDLITITPTAGVAILMNSAWEGVEEFLEVDGSQFNQETRDREVHMHAGIRVLLRPDYVRGRR